MRIFWFIFFGIVGYFFGNILYAKIIEKKLLKNDIIEKSKTNPGTMNMIRTYGLKHGFMVLFCDVAKSAIPCLAAYFVLGTQGIFVTGACCVLGHIYPVIYKFKGGKGIATAFGVFWVASPLVMTIAFAFLVLFLLALEYGGAGCIVVIAGLVSYEAYVNAGDVMILICLSVIFVLTWFAHRANIVRLLTGQEHKTHVRKFLKKKQNKDSQN